jgi:allene oxide cyclase-like protein
MQKLRFTAVLAAGCALALGGATLASGRDGNGSDESDSGQSFTVYAPTAADRIAFLPVTPGKFALGNRVVFSDDLFTEKGGSSLGIDGGVCTVVRVADAADQSGTLECHITFDLPDGQITTQELHTLTNGELKGTQPGAITGGTGKYRDAAGEVSVEFLSTTEANVTFLLDD